jgi:Zn-dependent protease
MDVNQILLTLSVWALPVLIAVTFHEAAHGFAAKLFGDSTAYLLGRVTLNPLKHIDPFGTVLLPGMLLLAHSPFLFGYAKPVPVNFNALRHPRLGMACVAAAGPLMNIALAFVSALAFPFVANLPPDISDFTALNLRNSLIVNAVLAVFNLFPIPPLDGGRIAVAVLPRFLGQPLARLEPFGMMILIALLFLVPLLSTQTGYNLNVASQALSRGTQALIRIILHLTGNG